MKTTAKNRPFKIVYGAYGKCTIVDDLTEAEVSKVLRDVVSNFYNQESGCINLTMARYYGEISIERNGWLVLTYNDVAWFRWRKGEAKRVDGWDDIFTKYVTKVG